MGTASRFYLAVDIILDTIIIFIEHCLEIVILYTKSSRGTYAADSKDCIVNNNH